jgi:polyhydroxyalkanoate synthesis regulator phasin
MSGHLARNIFELFTKEGRKAPLAELQKGGVQAVTVLGADQLAALIERAMDRAIEHRMLELSEPDKARLLADAKQEFQRLRSELDGLEGEAELKRRELAGLESRLENLETEFKSTGVSLDAELLAAASGPSMPVIDLDAEQLRILEIIRSEGVPDADLSKKLARAVSQFLASERAQAAEKAAAEQRERVQMLERRLAKLNDQLSRTEVELERALENSQHDDGVASIYKAVEGLRTTARDFERKKTMLAEIFRKNLVLQKGAVAG